MIGSIQPLGRGFKGVTRYVEFGRTGSRQDRVAWAETYNLPTRDLELAACFMGATANASVSGTLTPVYFFSVSFDVDDQVDEATMRRVARRTLRDMGLEEHEAIVVAHEDRSHPHLHFIVNRVHPTRFVLWRKWWDYPRLERSLRAQEVELGLRVVPGRHAPVPSLDRAREGHTDGWQPGAQWTKPLPGPKRGDHDFLRDVIDRAGEFLTQAHSWAELESGLAQRGLALTVRGGGFRITDGKRQVKASDVGRGCSRYHLEKRLGAYPDYRARMAVAGIAPVRQSERIVVAPPPVRPRRIPQFGDAGYGINELFGPAPARAAERSGVGVQPELASTPVRGSARFLKQIRAQAGPVLKHASTWEELARGLAGHGLTLRAKGGGFALTDGTQEVKASDVGRAFSRLHLENRLGRRPADAAPVIAAAAPTAPVVLPATPTLPRVTATQTIAPTADDADLDDQHQPVRSARTPQFGDAGHGIADLFQDPPQHQQAQKTRPDLERAPLLQPRQAEYPTETPAAADVGVVPAETSLEGTTAAPSMAERPEPGDTVGPVREEVGTPLVHIRPAQPRVERPRQEPQLTTESPRHSEPVSTLEPPPILEAATDNAPAPAPAQRDDAARTELAARIERLRRKTSPEFLGKRLRGGTAETPASTPGPHVEPDAQFPAHAADEISRTVGADRSIEAEKFLELANRTLEREARSREVNDAASEVAAAQQRLSVLDKAEELVERTRSRFKTQLGETVRDPNAFLGWFDRLGDPRKREVLRLLESKRAAFAREFSAALASGAARATKPQDLLGKVNAKTAEFVGSSNPAKRVFVQPVGEGQLRLAAHDGAWYLDTERGCRAAFREARVACGLPESATRDEVRRAARKHLASAKEREADAILRRDRLGKTLESHELPSALRRLSLADQEWVVKQLPALAKHVKNIAQVGIDLAEGPRRKGSGYDV